jgi:hypothetical protein
MKVAEYEKGPIFVLAGAKGGRVWKNYQFFVLAGAEGGRVWINAQFFVLAGAEGGRRWKNYQFLFYRRWCRRWQSMEK